MYFNFIIYIVSLRRKVDLYFCFMNTYEVKHNPALARMQFFAFHIDWSIEHDLEFEPVWKIFVSF